MSKIGVAEDEYFNVLIQKQTVHVCKINTFSAMHIETRNGTFLKVNVVGHEFDEIQFGRPDYSK